MAPSNGGIDPDEPATNRRPGFWRRCVLALRVLLGSALEPQPPRRDIEQEHTQAQRLARFGSWRWQIGSDTVDWSETLYDLYGLDPRDAAPSYAEQKAFYSAESQARLDQVINDAIEHGIAYEIEIELTHTSGQARWMMARGEPVRDANGKVIALHGIVHDITARRSAEQALRESEQRFKAIFNSTFQFIGLFEPDGSLVAANQPALDFTGSKLEDVIGKPVWELPWWGSTPEQQAMFRQAVERAKRGEFVRYDFEHIGADGRPMMIDFSLKPVLGEDGQVVLLIPEGRDVTEYRRDRDALAESEARVRAAMRNAPIGNALVGLDGQLLEVNDALCEMLGYSESELRGKHFQELTHPDDLSTDLEHMRELMSGNSERYGMYKRYFHADGRIVEAQLDVTLIRNAAHAPLYFISQVQDITERRRLEAQQQLLTQRLALALQVTRIGVWDWHIDSGIIDLDEATARIFGINPGEWTYDIWRSGVHPDDLPEAEARLQQSIAEQTPQSMSFRTRHPLFGTRYVEASFGPVLDANRKVVRIAGATIDVTGRHLSAKRMSESRALLRNLIDNLPIWVSMIDAQGRYMITNRRNAKTFGLPVDQIEGQHYTQVIEHSARDDLHDPWQKALSGETVEAHYSFVEDGRMLHLQGVYMPITEGPQAGNAMAVFNDVTALTQTQAQLSETNQRLEQRIAEVLKLQEMLHARAIRDELTGLYNRRHFDECLAAELEQSQLGGHDVSLILADLDHFKVLNDRYGHQTGDAVLRAWAGLMQQCMRNTDILCRYGGEEFAIIMPRCSPELACERADVLRARFSELSIDAAPGGPRVGTTVSLGVAYARAGDRSPSLLVHEADTALYQAKSLGRNRVQCETRDPFAERAAS
jgi:diguanylate cyclase (GGDEF)-like protein/PAS domain S-box-containing protein